VSFFFILCYLLDTFYIHMLYLSVAIFKHYVLFCVDFFMFLHPAIWRKYIKESVK